MANQTIVSGVDHPAGADDAGRRGAKPASLAAKAVRLYDAECALHAAHQSHVDGWVAAASQRLHLAVEDYCAALGMPVCE